MSSVAPLPDGVPPSDALYRKVALRLIPLLFLGYIFAFLNRVNIGFAKLEMLGELRFSETVYGLGAGIFFIGYFLFEVPSNVLMHRFGARRWLARIMITWGLVSAATMLVATPAQYYLARLGLGLAEAGFFPGIIFYLSLWFPAARRARITSLFIAAIAVSGIIGGPLSGWIMQAFAGVGGLSGWKWLFLSEATLPIAMGGLFLIFLPNSIATAPWLSEPQKRSLESALADPTAARRPHSLASVLGNGSVWLLSLVYFTLMLGLYGISFWMPQIIRGTGISSLPVIGLVSAIPYGVAVAAMIWVGGRSDRAGERRWHTVACFLVAAAGFVLIALAGGHTVLAVLGLVGATSGVLSAMPLFWTFPGQFLGGVAVAAGIAVINSVGNLGGFICPYVAGRLADLTHSQVATSYLIAGCLVAGAGLLLRIRAVR